MRVTYCGPRFDAPIMEDAIQVATPIDEACMVCRGPIAEGDSALRGLVMTADNEAPTGLVAELRWTHAECYALGTVGHVFGVCRCTGYDTTSREAARVLWRRLGDARASGLR